MHTARFPERRFSRLADVSLVMTVVDVSQVTPSDLDAFTQSFTDSFVRTVSVRTVGAILGNVAAGVALSGGVFYLYRTFGDSKQKSIESNLSLVEPVVGRHIPSDAWLKLFLCIFIDLLGTSSFVLPVVGELEDIAWGPVSAVAVKYLFGSNKLAILDLVKEVLPGTYFS